MNILMNYHCKTPERLNKILDYRDIIMSFTFSGRTNRMLTNEHELYKNRELLQLNACFLLLSNADVIVDKTITDREWCPKAFSTMFKDRIMGWNNVDSKFTPDEMIDTLSHHILYFMEPISDDVILPDQYEPVLEKISRIND